MPPVVATALQTGAPLNNKKIVFNDDGDEVPHTKDKYKNSKQAKSEPQKSQKQQQRLQNAPNGHINNKNKLKLNNNGDAKKPQKTKFNNNGTIGKSVAKANKFQLESEQTNKIKNKLIFHENGDAKKPQKIKFDDDGAVQKTFAKGNKPQQESEQTNKNKNKLIFDENGEVKKPQRIKFDDDGSEEKITNGATEDSDDADEIDKRWNQKPHQQNHTDDDDTQKKWYQVYTQYPCSDEVLDMKENEQLELFNVCKSAFDTEKGAFYKRNPSDSRWLQTALHKGTAKDRANAGALLVTSNPVGNLEALSTLIGFCKLSNKASNDVIAILTDLWQEVLLPPQRKLLSIHTRGGDWKLLKKDQSISKEKQRRIYAYWYFENELKEQYFEFLKNIMQGLQTGQEHNKNASIVAAARLLAYAPEKEQMLLTMLINKLGDPIAKVASKALHHLSEVAHKHPNMCGVIVAEAEKLLFRNNISERAQHFALCFLSSIAPAGHADVCTKLVNICFSLFKVLVQKGAINNRTMQAILRCLQKAIVEARPAKGSTELLNKDMQDTIYRLVHLADIRISVQTLGLLLQLICVKTEKPDRFYNALYVKLLDLNLINIGSKTAAQLLHIVHRAIHIDSHVARAQAFIKRLLQLALYTPPHIAAGCLIVIHKLLRKRHELIGGSGIAEDPATQLLPGDLDLDKFGSDDEEHYADANTTVDKPTENPPTEVKSEESEATASAGSSWHHAKLPVVDAETKIRNIDTCKYDPYHRVPAFAGAGYAARNELSLLRQHYHPTVQVFAEQILFQKRMDYYGDPLRDFGLPYFLERFSFKNPKKFDNQKAESGSIAHKRYVAHGARGKPVKSLTKLNCTEDERYIFNFLEHKRKQAELVQLKKKEKGVVDEPADADADEADYELKEGEVDDDEFETYLDGFFGKKSKADAEDNEDELNYLKELGGELQAKKKDKKKKTASSKADDEDAEDDIDDDWGDDDDDADADIDDELTGAAEDQSDDEDGSIDLEPLADNDDDEDDDDGSISLDDEPMDDDADSDTSDMPESPDEEDDDDEAPSKRKKSRKDTVSSLNERGFAQKLKNSNDMSSLFAAADDFSALLEETGKTKGQGTINAVYNKDKSSDKQMKWEEKRRSNSKNYRNKKFAVGKPIAKGKKRKH